MTGQKTKNTRIYTLFLSAVHPVGFEAYQRYHPDIKVMKNQDILQRVKDECKDVLFIGEASPVKAEEAISNIKEQREDLDGLLVFCREILNLDPIDELIKEGLPIVAVERPLDHCNTGPFHAYKESKVVTSYLPVYCDKDPKVYSLRIEDIARKVKLIDTISKMKELKVLVVTDKPTLGYFEPIGLQIETSREEYEEVYLDNLKETLGTEFITVPQRELFEKTKAADEEEAREVAQKWISEAVALRGTNEAEVLRSAKLYLGMKELMDEYNCGAITTEGFGWLPLGFQKAVEEGVPSQGMPTSQLLTDGIAAASETLTDCLITQQLGLYITGSAGLLGDYNIDPFINTAIICHCEGSLKPYQDRPKAPYIIRNLPFVEENTGGVCAQSNYPIGETVTVAKISMYKKKLSIFTGETVSGEEIFPYWDDVLGRNKVAVKTDAKALLENVSWETFGNHRAAFFGDYRQDFKDLAKLIGFEVLEKDRTR
ncbi:MAG: hypothetical protein U9Q78_04995 [Chloroflexota bacterium]|nr:hypothetical protein [Chloroflexota bacterium]